RLVSPLGPRRPGGIRTPVGATAALDLLLRQFTDDGRLLPGAADFQWQARQYELRRPAAQHGRFRCLHGAPRVPEGPTFELSRQRALNGCSSGVDHTTVA